MFHYTAWVSKNSASLAEGRGPGDLEILCQPPAGGCVLKYHVLDPVRVIITVNGVDRSVPITENVTVQGPRWYLGTKSFTSLDSISTDVEARVRVEAVNSGGNPIYWQTTQGPYAVMIRPATGYERDTLIEPGAGGITAQEMYVCETDEPGMQLSPGTKFTISEIPGAIFEIWSQAEPVMSISGALILRRKFFARRISA